MARPRPARVATIKNQCFRFDRGGICTHPDAASDGCSAQKAAVPWSAPQNGNAYEEVLSDAWSPIRAYWQDTSPATGRASRIPRCNSTCPTIRATSRSIRPSRSICGPIRRPCWRHWGQKRPILPAREGRGVQARHRERDCALLRYQTFRAGDAYSRGRGGHSRLPSLNDNVNRNSPDASSRRKEGDDHGQAGALHVESRDPAAFR